MGQLADLVNLAHAAYMAALAVAPFALLAGTTVATGAPAARWLTHPLLRLFHLASSGFAVLQAALGWSCPLTDFEAALRGRPVGSMWLPTCLDGQPPAAIGAAVVVIAVHLTVGAWAQARVAWRPSQRVIA